MKSLRDMAIAFSDEDVGRVTIEYMNEGLIENNTGKILEAADNIQNNFICSPHLSIQRSDIDSIVKELEKNEKSFAQKFGKNKPNLSKGRGVS